MDRLLNVEATSACYANCSMCPHDKVKNVGFLCLDVVDALINKVKNYSLYEVSISGRGEPTLHPQLVDIVNKLKCLNTPISIVTTTAGLNERNYKEILDAVDILRISVSSIEEDLFKIIHRGLEYKKTWKMIEQVISYCPEKVYIHLVGGEDTYSGLEATVNYFKKHNVNNIFLFPLWNRGGNLDVDQDIIKIRQMLVEKYSIHYSEDEYLDDEKRKKLNLPNYCPIGDTSISVNCFGEMIGCFQDFENHNKVCTVFEEVDFLSKRCQYFGKMQICKDCNSLKQVKILPDVEKLRGLMDE